MRDDAMGAAGTGLHCLSALWQPQTTLTQPTAVALGSEGLVFTGHEDGTVVL
jgi:hypothetical protein